jgi:Tfp pilus assembly protein PilO
MRISRDHVIVAGIVAVMVAVFSLVVYLPQSRRLSDLRTARASLTESIETDTARATCVPDMIRDVEAKKRQFKDFDQRLPKQKELAEFLREISSTAVANRLENQVVEPGSPTRGKLYNRLPIIMRFDSNFAGLVGFLQQIEKMERLTRIEKIAIKPLDNDGTGQRLHIELVLNIYFAES